MVIALFNFFSRRQSQHGRGTQANNQLLSGYAKTVVFAVLFSYAGAACRAPTK
jgi:hypothetical protein